VPFAVRKPLGIALWRLRVWTANALEQSLGRLPVLASRDLIYRDSFYDLSDSKQAHAYRRFAEALVRLRAPASVVDVGCGTGLMLETLANHGVRVVGVEGSRAALRRARRVAPVVRANLERGVPPLGRFDACLCIEVAEHLTARRGPRLVEDLIRLSDTVVFTAAPPGEGGTAHINVRLREYWVALFSASGFVESPLADGLLEAIADFPEPRFLHRLMVFERAPSTVAGQAAG
jgi:SAM-dependent methyltransferase